MVRLLDPGIFQFSEPFYRTGEITVLLFQETKLQKFRQLSVSKKKSKERLECDKKEKQAGIKADILYKLSVGQQMQKECNDTDGIQQQFQPFSHNAHPPFNEDRIMASRIRSTAMEPHRMRSSSAAAQEILSTHASIRFSQMG